MDNRSARCGVLISVRDLDELAQLRRLPIDVIDFKEPLAGPLAAVDPAVWQAAAAGKSRLRHSAASPGIRFSAALGEADQALECVRRVPENFEFAKAGTWKMHREDEILSLWRQIDRGLPSGVTQVGVAYADAAERGGLSASKIAKLAHRHGLRWLLVDTFSKTKQTSLDFLSDAEYQRVHETCNRHGIRWTLAGGLQRTSLARFVDAGPGSLPMPDMFAFRGAVCANDRTGRVDVGKCRQLLDTIASLPPLSRCITRGRATKSSNAVAG